jgi:hypothetical protein
MCVATAVCLPMTFVENRGFTSKISPLSPPCAVLMLLLTCCYSQSLGDLDFGRRAQIHWNGNDKSDKKSVLVKILFLVRNKIRRVQNFGRVEIERNPWYSIFTLTLFLQPWLATAKCSIHFQRVFGEKQLPLSLRSNTNKRTRILKSSFRKWCVRRTGEEKVASPTC